MAQTWDDALRASGYRVTPQRQLVLEAVTKLEHATPEEIYAEVKQTAVGVNVSTVYRTLELLEQIGLVTHTHLGHGPPSYSTRPHEHVHLVCHRCGKVTEIPNDELTELAARLQQQYGFELDPGHLALSGRCRTCAAAADEETA